MTTDATPPPVQHIGAGDVELKPGYKVGEYEIEAKIGEGGFGSVFKAVHPLIGKLAAVKVLSRQYSTQPEMVSRFVAEARAVNQIRHRHIIDIFSFGSLDDGRHYYVMEYLDGMPLEDYIGARGRLGLADAIPVLRAIAKALDAAHAKGIAHRDLKPDNVFLAMAEDGSIEPKLLDFGIAKLLSDNAPQAHKTRTGAPMGTPHYMSPEQCRGRDVDHRTDIYAFGVMAYKMLTGKLPFEGEDYMEILFKQVNEEAAPLSSVVSDLSAQVNDAVAWMMKKDPAERPPNLVTAVRSLEDAARAAGIAVPLAPAPSGVYAAPTSPPNIHATPDRLARFPSEDEGLGLAGTLDANTLEDGVTLDADAMENVAVAAGKAATARTAPPEQASRSRSKLVLVAAAVVVVVVLAVVVNGMRSGDRAAHQDDALQPGAGPAIEAAAAQPQDETPAVKPGGPESKPGGPESKPGGAQNEPGGPENEPNGPKSELPAFVTVNIKGPPRGTEVYGPGGLLGVVPGTIQIARGDEPVQLTFKARRYRTRSEEIVPSEDRILTIELERERRRRGSGSPSRDKASDDKKKSRDTIENPFDN